MTDDQCFRYWLRRARVAAAMRAATAEECSRIAERCRARADVGAPTAGAIPLGEHDEPVPAGPRPAGAAAVWSARADAWAALVAMGGGSTALAEEREHCARMVSHYAERLGARATIPAREALMACDAGRLRVDMRDGVPCLRLAVEPRWP